MGMLVIRQRCIDIQRLEKVLEDARIKLSSVATDLTGVSSLTMLGALIEGSGVRWCWPILPATVERIFPP